MLNELGFRILNCITWAKTNPPPNLSCKFFTHSTEFILWARKNKKVTHYYNYELMKKINGGTNGLASRTKYWKRALKAFNIL